MIKDKVETVTADRVKPANIEHKPANECTRQCRATPTSNPTASKPTAKVREPRMALVGARSPTMSKPPRTKVYTKKNSNARSTIQTKETVPAVKQRCDATEEQSHKRPTLYRAPHAKTPITSRANGKDEGLWTYSRILLHLRNDLPVLIPQKTRADNRSDNNADLNDEAATWTNTCWTTDPHSCPIREDGSRGYSS